MTHFDRQVVLDLMMTPATFAMEIIGITSFALAGLDIVGPAGYLVGLAGVAGGIGWAITRVITDADGVVAQAVQNKRNREQKKLKSDLDAFDKKLKEAKDWDARRPFQELRNLYNEFNRLAPTMMDLMRGEIEDQFLELFRANVDIIKQAHENLLTIRESNVEKVRSSFRKRRMKSLEVVHDSVEKLTAFISGIAEASHDKDEIKTSELHDSLRSNLEIMREADDEVTKFMSSRQYE